MADELTETGEYARAMLWGHRIPRAAQMTFGDHTARADIHGGLSATATRSAAGSVISAFFV